MVKKYGVPAEILLSVKLAEPSPDDVYRALQELGFKRALRRHSCEALF
jgi:hypothetical protein